jgi:hypothetical protein
MPVVNRLPLGLLSFLGIQNGGRYPDQLLPALAPVLDLSGHYVNTNREYLNSGPVGVAAFSATQFFTVPVGQWWFVALASGVTSALGAGVTYGATIQLTDAAGLVNIVLSQPTPPKATGAQWHAQARNFWAGPGERIGVYTSELVAGPVNVAMTLAIARFAM